MKRIAFIALILSIVGGLTAQTKKCGIDTRALVAEEVTAGKTEIAMLAKMTPGFDRGEFEKAGIVFGAQAGDIVTMIVPVRSLPLLESSKQVVQYSISHHIAAPTCNDMRYDTRTNEVHSGEGVTNNTGYDGSGVYIGITDWGFDYTHPNINTFGVTNYRVDKAWDHFRMAGPAPTGFTYGTELTGHDALMEAKGDTSNLYGYGTHGTHVAGIAAGRGIWGNYQGQAPNARMLLCSFGLGEAEWMDAVGWMRQVAIDSSRRLVVNSSWGMYSFSTLDGTSLLSQAINNWSDEGIVFCTSAGNNGNDYFHISHTFETTDTVHTVASRTVYNDYVGHALILWGEEGHDFGVSLSNGDVHTPYIWTNTDTIIYDTFNFSDGSQLTYRAIVEHANPFDNRPHIQFNTVTTKALHMHIAANSGTVHAWNVANKSNHAGNEGMAFQSASGNNYIAGNNDYGISEPACAAKCITVAAHTTDWPVNDSTRGAGELTNFTSYGPLIDGSMKPDISAPGHLITSSISRWSSERYTEIYGISYTGYHYIWSQMSGTSMASPCATGIVALVLQANPQLSTDQVRDIIFSTARNDWRTGPLVDRDSMDVRWGWGKIDALNAVNEALQRQGTLNISHPTTTQQPMHIYPNPTSGMVHVSAAGAVDIYTINGHHIGRFAASTPINTSTWPKGVYVVRCGNQTAKLVVR